jgi:hypothetical protein
LRLGKHIAGPESDAGDGVLDGGNQHPQINGQAGIHDHHRQRQHVGGAAHVLLHQQHRGGRLDVEAAGVEADALAHQGELGAPFLAPTHFEKPRRLMSRPAHRMDHRESLGQQRLAGDHFGLWPCSVWQEP